MKKERDFIVNFGKQGSGKSYLNKKYIIPTLAKKKAVFIIDTLAEYHTGDRDVSYKADKKFTDHLELLDFILQTGGPDPGIYILMAQSDKACKSFFKYFALAKAACSIIVEEADRFCSPHNINPDLKKLINYGRHWAVDLVFTARRAAAVHKDVTSQADCIVSFNQTELNDIKALRKIWAQADQLPDLEKHHFLTMGDKRPKHLKLFEPGKIKKLDKS